MIPLLILSEQDGIDGENMGVNINRHASGLTEVANEQHYKRHKLM